MIKQKWASGMKEIRMKAEISKKNDARSCKEAEMLQTKDVKAEPQAADCSGRGRSQSASTVARGCTATVFATATVPVSATATLTRRKYQGGTADPEYRPKLPLLPRGFNRGPPLSVEICRSTASIGDLKCWGSPEHQPPKLLLCSPSRSLYLARCNTWYHRPQVSSFASYLEIDGGLQYRTPPPNRRIIRKFDNLSDAHEILGNFQAFFYWSWSDDIGRSSSVSVTDRLQSNSTASLQLGLHSSNNLVQVRTSNLPKTLTNNVM